MEERGFATEDTESTEETKNRGRTIVIGMKGGGKRLERTWMLLNGAVWWRLKA